MVAQEFKEIKSEKIMFKTTEIEKIIPHRGDMRMVDEIREYSDTSAVGMSAIMNFGVLVISLAIQLCLAFYK